MKHIRIDYDQIREACSSDLTYKRGLRYYQNGQVKKLKYIAEDRYVEFVVAGSEQYYGDVTFDKYGEFEDVNCECEAFFIYPGICKHIVAALLEYKEKIQDVSSLSRKAESVSPHAKGEKNNRGMLLSREERVMEEIIRLFEINQGKLASPGEKDVLQTEYILKVTGSSTQEYNHRINLELKTGLQRTYVVKNIYQFLNAVDEEKPYIFTSRFSYDPVEHVFSREDASIIRLLIQASQDICMYTRSYLSYRPYFNERELLISPFFASQLLPLLAERNVTLQYGGKSYSGFLWRDEPLPVNLELKMEKENQYVLTGDHLQELSFIGSGYNYVLFRGDIYPIAPEDKETIIPFILTMQRERTDKLTMSNNTLSKAASLILPSLKKRLQSIKIDEKVSRKLIAETLKTKLYLDYEDKKLTAKLEYHYGVCAIDPFRAEQQEEQIILRDMHMEGQMMAYFEQSCFKYDGKKLYLEDEEEIYSFLYHVLPVLHEQAEVFTTASLQNIWSSVKKTPKVRVDIDPAVNLLHVQFDIEGIEEGEINKILGSIVEKKKYYRLADGSFLSLEAKEMEDIQNVLAEMNLPKSKLSANMQLNSVHALRVSDLLDNAPGLGVKKGKQLKRLIQHITDPDMNDFPVPPSLERILRDYQKTGYQWLSSLAAYGFGGILADDMGLGKTLQSIAFILAQREQNNSQNPVLIVAPSSLIYNWEKEFNKFAPELQAKVIAGNKEERYALLEALQSQGADVWITSYPLLRRDLECYKDQHFSTLFLDEAQYIKNAHAQTTQAVKELKSNFCFALTGTPMENSVEELRSIFDTVLPGLLPGPKVFRQMEQEKIARRVKPFILRRLKKDVLTELPEKIESIQLIEMNKEQKKLYLAYLERMKKETKEALEKEGLAKSRIKILAGLTRLRQLCCHPALFIDNYKDGSAKLDRLIELMSEMKESGNRVVLFSQFTQMLQMISAALEDQKWDYHYLDGQTSALERVELCERFNQGEKDVFLVSLKAGGTGLNLTGADTVILFDLWWNPAVEQQAQDRVYRMGQKRIVQVLKLVTRGTIEEKIHELQEYKKELIDKFIQPGDALLSGLSEADIRELLSL